MKMKSTIMQSKFVKTALVCLCAAASFSSCEKDNEESNNGSGWIPNNTIVASVDEGSSYNDKIDSVKAELEWYNYNNGHWETLYTARAAYKDGGFTLELPETIDERYLEGVFGDMEVPDGVHVSNPDLKGTAFDAIYAYDSTGFETGEFYHGTYTTPEAWYSYYNTGWISGLAYTNKDANVTGSYVDDEDEDEDVYRTFNVSFKKGWNIIYEKWTKTENRFAVEITSQVPADAKWYFMERGKLRSNTQSSRLNKEPLFSKRKTR